MSVNLPENVKRAFREFMIQKIEENFPDWVTEFDESLYGAGIEWDVSEDSLDDIFQMQTFINQGISKFQ